MRKTRARVCVCFCACMSDRCVPTLYYHNTIRWLIGITSFVFINVLNCPFNLCFNLIVVKKRDVFRNWLLGYFYV